MDLIVLSKGFTIGGPAGGAPQTVQILNFTYRPGSRLKKNIIIDMSSITGGLWQNFDAASSLTPVCQILVHDEEENFWRKCMITNFRAG